MTRRTRRSLRRRKRDSRRVNFSRSVSIHPPLLSFSFSFSLVFRVLVALAARFARLLLVFPPSATRRFFCPRRFAIFHRLFAAYVLRSDTHTYRSKGTRQKTPRGERRTSSRDGKTSTESRTEMKARAREKKTERERESARLVKGKAANTRIFIYANGIRIQLIVRSHTRSDSRDGYSGIVPACQFA